MAEEFDFCRAKIGAESVKLGIVKVSFRLIELRDSVGVLERRLVEETVTDEAEMCKVGKRSE